MNRPYHRSDVPGRRTPTRAGPSARIRLARDRVYILPTPAGLLFAATVFLMLLGSINYSLGLGFALTFLLAGVGVVAMLLTYRNVAELELRAHDAPAVFAGDRAVFPLELRNPSRTPRIALEIGARPRNAAAPTQACCDVPGGSAHTCPIPVEAATRGTLWLPPLRISSTFPLGLFRAWSQVEFTARCTVYPRPEPRSVPAQRAGNATGGVLQPAGDDFVGLRSYRAGDAPAHIAWSALARGAGLATKQFQADRVGETWVRWDTVSPPLPTEQALSRMTRWILDLAREDCRFGLELPGRRFPPDRGSSHMHACLRALARFGERR